jgi:hypothetical protein
MSESVQASGSRTWARPSHAIVAIAIGIVGAVAAKPESQAESRSGLSRSPAYKPVIAQSICDSDIVRRAVTRMVLRNRGDRPGVKVSFGVEHAKPGSVWDYEVSVTSTTGSEGTVVVRTDSIRANQVGSGP